MTQRRDRRAHAVADGRAADRPSRARARRLQTIERRLDAFDLGRRLARNRARARRRRMRAASDRHVAARITRRARFGSLAGRLDSLSPLAVLARGYAVCWNDDRTRAIRDAADVATGDTVHVTLSRGAIAAKVSGIE